ncbi:MAG: hypothetical protein PHV07_02885 [Oscillospiraceae bacterium]|nr:hypothetical protein [Oscillospiraceae bacterium]
MGFVQDTIARAKEMAAAQQAQNNAKETTVLGVPVQTALAITKPKDVRSIAQKLKDDVAKPQTKPLIIESDPNGPKREIVNKEVTADRPQPIDENKNKAMIIIGVVVIAIVVIGIIYYKRKK